MLLLQNVLRTPPQCKVRSKRLLGAARNALTGDRDLKMLRPARFEGKSTTPVTMDPSLSQRDVSFLPQGALRILYIYRSASLRVSALRWPNVRLATKGLTFGMELHDRTLPHYTMGLV